MAATYSNSLAVKGGIETARNLDLIKKKDPREYGWRFGQAYNRAHDELLSLGKANDTKLFFNLYVKHFQQINFLFKSTFESLVTALDDPEFISLLNNVDNHLQYLNDMRKDN